MGKGRRERRRGRERRNGKVEEGEIGRREGEKSVQEEEKGMESLMYYANDIASTYCQL